VVVSVVGRRGGAPINTERTQGIFCSVSFGYSVFTDS
jgi:hypothetical protein